MKKVRVSLRDWIEGFGNDINSLKTNDVVYRSTKKRSAKTYVVKADRTPHLKKFTSYVLISTRPVKDDGTAYNQMNYNIDELYIDVEIDTKEYNSSKYVNDIRNTLSSIENITLNGLKKVRELENHSGVFNRADVTKIVNKTFKATIEQFLDGGQIERMIRSVCDIDNEKLRLFRENWLKELKLKD